MYPLKSGTKLIHITILAIGLYSSTFCFAAHIGGGFGGGAHFNAGAGNWNHNTYNHYDVHNNNINVGNYHPGRGWVAPVYVAPSYIINGNDYDENCQTVQQCDAYGNCTQTQDCQ